MNIVLAIGGAKAYELAKLLKAKYIIPMANGELMQKVDIYTMHNIIDI